MKYNKIALLTVMMILLSSRSYTCDFFVLYGINNNDIFSYNNQPGDLNDPLDLITFLKFRSGSSPLNDDGYGIIAYEFGSYLVEEHNSWYLTGSNTWYMGNYADEPLDNAVLSLMGNSNVSLVMGHARNGTGGNGNHPFLFEFDGKSYSFIHNGFISSNAKSDIVEFLGAEWFNEHQSQWEGAFYNAATFIDSELLFHYLMYYITQMPEDIPTALNLAFNNRAVIDTDMSYILKDSPTNKCNFVLSDGEDLYLYRNTTLNGTSFNLSYENFDNQFIALKTNSNLDNSVAKNQLLRISRSGDVFDLETAPYLVVPLNTINTDFSDATTLELTWQVAENSNIEGFSIYQARSKNFQRAVRITPTMVEYNALESFYSFADIEVEKDNNFFWIETHFNGESSELSAFIEALNPFNPSDDVTQLINIDSIYPNPFKSQVTIDGYIPPTASVKIYNIKGQFVRQLSASRELNIFWDGKGINDRPVANGVYILVIKDKNSFSTHKMVKLK